MPAYKDLNNLVWLDGDWVDINNATTHIMSHTLHYGSGVFEGERAYSGNVFKEKEHHDRLHKSANIMDFQIDQSADEITQIVRDIIKKQNLTNAYIRPVAWRGTENLSISANGCKTHLAVCTYNWESYPEEKATGTGLKLQTALYRRPAPDTAPTQAKAAGLYMIASISKQKAERAGFDDCLMHDFRGFIAESSTSNFFMAKDGEIHTPVPDCILNGLTRQTIIKLAKDMGYRVRERRIKPHELRTADEIFLTGTALEVLGVGKIDDRTYKIGPVTKKLRKAYLELVNS